MLGAALLNELVVQVTAELAASGAEVPVFTSQNVQGGDEANASLVERYRPRIPLMKP